MGKSNCQTDPRNWKQVKYEQMQFRLHQPGQRRSQESNLITNQAHSVLYDNAKILPIYQKLEQRKESAEQEATKRANWLPVKRTVYCMTTQKFYEYTKN